MIEIIFLVWGAIYLLWLASTIAMGEFKKTFIGVTIAFATMPLLLVAAFVGFFVVAPLGVVFSQKVRDAVVSQREKSLKE